MLNFVSTALGVVADTVPIEDRGRYVGVSQMGFLVRHDQLLSCIVLNRSIPPLKVGPCVAPVVGGVLVDKLGWR